MQSSQWSIRAHPQAVAATTGHEALDCCIQSPPPPTGAAVSVMSSGKTIGKIWSGHFWYTNFWVPDPHPPTTPLLIQACRRRPGIVCGNFTAPVSDWVYGGLCGSESSTGQPTVRATDGLGLLGYVPVGCWTFSHHPLGATWPRGCRWEGDVTLACTRAQRIVGQWHREWAAGEGRRSPCLPTTSTSCQSQPQPP